MSYITLMVMLLAFSFLGMYFAIKYGETPDKERVIASANLILLIISVSFVVIIWGNTIAMFNVLTRTCYDNNISVEGYEQTFEDYRVSDFRESIQKEK